MSEGQLHRLPSRALGRPVWMWSFGWWGAPVLAMPTAAGMAHDWQHSGAVRALWPLIAAGRIKLYCPETNVAECWTHAGGDPARRLERHRAYEDFVVHELVPFIRADCRTPDARIAVAGPSVGGWYAVNLALKHPEIFWWALSLSGRFGMEKMVGGYWSDDLYFQLPLAYVPNLAGADLERVRRQTSVTLVVGQGAFEGACLPETLRLSEVLRARGIACERDVWGHDVTHQWPWWSRQLQHHLGRRFS
ncbi:MAG: alpha/beta hydrolase-fold protein [Myxococcota bacterium]